MRFSIYLDYKKAVNNDGKIDVHGFFYSFSNQYIRLVLDVIVTMCNFSE